MRYFLLIAAVWMLASCTIDSDATQRAQIYADASVSKVEAEAEADKEEAYQRRLSEEARAVADVDVERVRQDGKTERTQMFVWIIIAVVGGVLGWRYLEMHSVEREGAMPRTALPAPQNWRVLPPPPVLLEAQRRDCDVEWIDGGWCLVQPESRQIVARARRLTA